MADRSQTAPTIAAGWPVRAADRTAATGRSSLSRNLLFTGYADAILGSTAS